MAQYTVDGSKGVEGDHVFQSLKMNKDMSKTERLLLAKKFIKLFGGEK